MELCGEVKNVFRDLAVNFFDHFELDISGTVEEIKVPRVNHRPSEIELTNISTLGSDMSGILNYELNDTLVRKSCHREPSVLSYDIEHKFII